MKERIGYIDLAKGFCILLVVLDHIANEGYFWSGDYPLNEIFDQMRMPLYFILSGLFFKEYSGGLREFIIRKTNKILVPYLFFILLYRAITWLVQNYTNFASTGTNIAGIWGPLWFLRCLFFMNVIFALAHYAIHRLAGTPIVGEILMAICMFGVGVAGYHVGNWHLNFGTALTCMPLFWSGYFLNKKLHLLEMNIKRGWALSISVLLFVTIHFLYMGDNYFYSNTYSSPLPLLYVSGLAGSVAILLLSSIIRRLPIVSYVGRYSIIILCTHQVIITLLVAAKHFLPEMYRQTGLTESLVFFAITVGISILCCRPLKKYLPWFTAQKDLIKIPCSDVDEFLQ